MRLGAIVAKAQIASQQFVLIMCVVPQEAAQETHCLAVPAEIVVRALASTRFVSHLVTFLRPLEVTMMIATAHSITSVILNIARTTSVHLLATLLTSRDHTQTNASAQPTVNVVLETAQTMSASQPALPPMHTDCMLTVAIVLSMLNALLRSVTTQPAHHLALLSLTTGSLLMDAIAQMRRNATQEPVLPTFVLQTAHHRLSEHTLTHAIAQPTLNVPPTSAITTTASLNALHYKLMGLTWTDVIVPLELSVDQDIVEVISACPVALKPLHLAHTSMDVTVQ
jgi:hypothetical protein